VETNSTNQLLKNKYDLHKSIEVEHAARITDVKSGQQVPQDPLVRIQNYLNRFHEIVDNNGDRKEHALDLIKRKLYSKYVIKPDKIPESFWENQERILRERGQAGDLLYIDWEEFKRQNAESIIADQEASLNRWIDYLSSNDAPYPDALKYWTLRNVVGMAEYDKEKKIYPQRSHSTTKPFPDLNREALAYVLDAVEKKYNSKSSRDINDSEFEKLLKSENFSKLYAWAIDKVAPADLEERANTDGEWVKYDKGSNHMLLARSLQGHGTGWCTAGESTAKAQLREGDFYVYYSKDLDGKSNVPRAAIRMEGNKIAEVRGIAADQNLEGALVPVVDEKLKDFPDGESYKKKVKDMQRLTEIENKMQGEQRLTPEDLVFLYEIDSQIEGFGFQRDPRIYEIRDSRSPEVDVLIIFDCEPEQIAHNASQINKNTKVYLGSLEEGIFSEFKKYEIENVYTSFPEGRVKFNTVTIGGKSARQLKGELNEKDVYVHPSAVDILTSPDFKTLKNVKECKIVRLDLESLGLQNPTSDEIYKKADDLGLSICPAELGPMLCLEYSDQIMQGKEYVAIKPILVDSPAPRIFNLVKNEVIRLYGDHANPLGGMWKPTDRFIFTLT